MKTTTKAMKELSKESQRQKIQQRLQRIYERRRNQPQPFEGISALELFHAERSPQDRYSVVRYLRSRHKQTFDDWIEFGCILFLAGFRKKDFKPAPGKVIPPFRYATARKLIQLAESDRMNDPRYMDRYPDKWETLYLIMRLSRPAFEAGIRENIINKACIQNDIHILKMRFSQYRPPLTKFTVLLRPCPEEQAEAERRQNEVDNLMQYILAQPFVKDVVASRMSQRYEDRGDTVLDDDSESFPVQPRGSLS